MEKNQASKQMISENRYSDFYPELLTETELVQFLRIPEVSKAKDYHNVIENLKRMHDLPRVHICGKPLYPLEAIREWIKEKTVNGK
jgi:hypothetical protein